MSVDKLNSVRCVQQKSYVMAYHTGIWRPKECYQHRNPLNIMLAFILLMVIVLVSSCKRLDEKYDAFGRYRACVSKLGESHVETDVRSALARGDHRFFLTHWHGYGVAVEVPGMPDCQLRKIYDSEIDLQLPVDDYRSYSSGSPPAACIGAFNKYKLLYNVEMRRQLALVHESGCN